MSTDQPPKSRMPPSARRRADPRDLRGAAPGSGSPCRAPGPRWCSRACRSAPPWCPDRACCRGGLRDRGRHRLRPRPDRRVRLAHFPGRPPRPARKRSWPVFFVVGAVLLVLCWLLGQRWQGQLRDMMSAPPEPFWSKLLLPVAAAFVFVLLVAIGRGLRGAYRWLWGLLSRWIGRRAARAIGWVVVTGLSVLLMSGLLQDVLLKGLDNSFSLADRGTAPGVEQPTSTLRSGGPDSLVAWDTLGLEGRNYTGTGPGGQQIADFWGARRWSRSAPTRASSRPPTWRSGPGWPWRISSGRVDSTGSTSWWPAPPAPAGSTRRPSTRWSTRSAATWPASASSTATCRPGSPSWSIRRAPGRPGGPCSTRCTSTGRTGPRTTDRSCCSSG